MAKTSCVKITPDLRKKYCEVDNISENDLAIFLYDYLENPRTLESIAEDLDLENESKTFRELYNYRFKLGNSRFLISNPNTFKQANANWNKMKEYGMDDEGYLALDSPEKRKLLDWLNQSDDFKDHYVVYNDLSGNTIIKVERPIESDDIYQENESIVLNSSKDFRLEELRNKDDLSIVDLLDLIDDNSDYKPIIELLKTKKQKGRTPLLKGVKVKIVSSIATPYTSYVRKLEVSRGYYKRAYYDASTKTIIINSDGNFSDGRADSVIMHEVLHAITVNRIANNTKLKSEFDKIIQEYNNNIRNYKYHKEHPVTGVKNEHYIHEFIADIWSNKETINNLKSIKSTNELTLWDKIKNFFTKIFINSEGTLMADASDALYRLLDSPELVNNVDTFYEEEVVNEEIVEANPFEEADRIYDKLRKHFAERVAYSQNFKEDHIYLYKDSNGNWVKVDKSVSQLTEKGFDANNPWKEVSTGLGDTNDVFMRDFFANQLKPLDSKGNSPYPNLTGEQYKALLKGAQEVVKHLNSLFGEGNYKVSSQEFPILGYITEDGKTKTVAGTMDLLIYTKEGDFYIIDMKTKRVSQDGSIDISRAIEGYSKQQYMYKNILEAAIPELRGRIKTPMLLVSSVSYPSPRDGYVYSKNKSGNVMVTYINTNGIKTTKPIQMMPNYSAPQYAKFITVEDFDAEIKELLAEFPEMTKEEFETEFGNLEIIKKSIAERRQITLNTEQSKEAAETEALYSIIPKEEVAFLGHDIAITFTKIVDELLTDTSANEEYFTDENGVNPYASYNLTKMSREDLLNLPFMVDNILNIIKELEYNPESDSNVGLDEGAKSKISVAYNNFDALVKNSYTEFIKLEGLTFNENVSTDNYIPDGVDGSIQNTEDSAENEENEREHWQIGIRNMSAMSGLSSRLRRFLSTLEDIDSEGYAKADRFGYNRPVTINGHEVVNSLLSWLKNCNTLEEMEDVLKNLQVNHPWIQSILDGIKEEPIRSQFFQCFRKDFTEYSTIITVKRESEDGRTRWETVNRIINTTGAVDKVINEVRDAFFMKDISIFKDGLFDIPKIKSITDNIKALKNKLKNQTVWNNIKQNPNSSEINEVKNILNSLGIMFDSVILADLVASDTNVVSFIGSKLNKILTEAAYITDNLLSGVEQKTYDPFSRDSKNSVYGNYRNIATIAEDYVVDALEASTYANGKMYYSFVSPSYIGQLLNNLTTMDSERVEKYLEENYGKYEWFKNSNTGKWNIKWLEDIASSDRQQIQRKVQLSYEGTDYVDLGERSYMLSLLKEFFYDQKNKTYAWYRVPTLSNKPSSEFIRNKRYSGNFIKELTDQLYNIFIQEIKRAQTVVERAISETITPDDKIKNYDIKINGDIKNVLDKIKNGERVTLDDVVINGKYIFEDSGASFKFLDDFVTEIVYKSQTGQYIIDKIFNKNLNVANDAQNISSVTSLIGAFMENKVQRTYDYFEELGLIGRDLQFMLPVLRVDNKTPKDKIKEALMPAIREYVWNDFVATANIVQLTATDLAFYKDSVDFQKRYAQIHSPGLRLNKSATNAINGKKTKVSDGKLRTLLIKDKISKSTIKENVRVALTNHLNSIEDPIAKKEFKMMLDLIVDSFDSINEADAQAFTSPTGYMKKMVMSGSWDNAMQEAYEKIRSGNYDINDLGVVWQPLKPFVYTHTSMNGHSSTSKYIKVNSQHKNSEYLLIIADALTRGDKQNNTLNAIMEFMESTHYDKSGNYKQDGIDTIEFNSAIKVGEHGVIDLNDLTAKEVKTKLNEAYTNEANVIAFPVEDYAIQQNVPAHFKEHSQPMGSQIRALVLSDLTGTAYRPLGKNISYTPEEVNTVYQDLIGRNVKRSWDKLAKDLKLDGTRLERNKKLSELLLEEMSKDARYGADLKRAVMLNAEGEFIIPLDDPIHSSRIQQLINSIVKSRINKQRTKGGPVVQASSFGLSEDLNIIFCDSEGKELDTITKFGKRMGLSGKTLEKKYREYLEKNQATVKHFECYVPLPSGLFEELLIQDGKVISIEEATNPNSPFYVDGIKNCLNAIGYRIPTEDTYSMVPIKIKGFVPKAAGEVVMLPKEITLLSGSDKYHCFYHYNIKNCVNCWKI